MIDIIDKKYGRIIIYDESDVPAKEIKDPRKHGIYWIGFKERADACIIGFRNRKKEIVKLLKNRYSSLEDDKIKQFIFNYDKEEDDPIGSRFDILDIR